MLTWTNMTRPGDPYRTGQQLYRRPSRQLAAFTVVRLAGADRSHAASCAVVYLPLRRACAVAVTEETLAFGFRAASTGGQADGPALAALADLDLIQARRHAAILAGHALPADLSALRAAGAGAMRGLAAVSSAWADRANSASGMAIMIDTAEDLPGGRSLAGVAEGARLAVCADGACRCWLGEHGGREPLAGVAVCRALAVALACACHRGRYQWDRTLDVRRIMAAHAWDCLPQPGPCGLPGASPLNAAGASLPASGQKPPAGTLL